MSNRALMAAEHDVVRELSPKGAFWKLSPDVMKHTPDCIALGDRWWPWSVIDAVGPPPRHPGCRCQLVTEGEAIGLGYIEAGYADGVDAKDALKRAKKALKDAATVLEAVSTDEWRSWLAWLEYRRLGEAFDPAKPRDPHGRWTKGAKEFASLIQQYSSLSANPSTVEAVDRREAEVPQLLRLRSEARAAVPPRGRADGDAA